MHKSLNNKTKQDFDKSIEGFKKTIGKALDLSCLKLLIQDGNNAMTSTDLILRFDKATALQLKFANLSEIRTRVEICQLEEDMHQS